ncbi:hypothetical protein ABC270_01775 [Curtobacterium sp. 1P10AnD]|uniref:hypothetical protein n=1 Tax=Curtobacterium sp. 1P10AnD TaxID=3132283 RepID=UPI0039A2EDA1
MEHLTDVGRGDWLVRRAGAWSTIGGVVGTGFTACARVLHPVTAHRDDRGTTDRWGDHPVLETATWRWADVAARTGGTVDARTRWDRLTGLDDESDLPFPDGWRAEPPQEGWLDPSVLAVLFGHLATATSTPDDLVAGIWDGWGDLNGSGTLVVGWQRSDDEPGPTHAERVAMQADADQRIARHRADQDALVAALAGPRLQWPLRDLVCFATDASELADPTWTDRATVGDGHPMRHTPQLLWPEDRAWAMATEIDLDSTLVAGSRALVEAILDDPRLEAFEVHEDDSLS